MMVSIRWQARLHYLKLLYREFQKYEAITVSVGDISQENTPVPVIKEQNISNALF